MNARAIATLKVRRASPTASVIELTGDVTAASEQGLMAAYARAVEDDPRAVVLDFGALEYLNSGGIGLLVALLVRARRQHRRLLAVGLGGHYREIFALTRLDEAIGIHDDLAAALAAGELPERRPR
jgi:anti-sigma B factor antagonist